MATITISDIPRESPFAAWFIEQTNWGGPPTPVRLTFAELLALLSPTTPQPSEPRPRITDAGVQVMNEALGLDDTRAHKPGKPRAARVVKRPTPALAGSSPSPVSPDAERIDAMDRAQVASAEARKAGAKSATGPTPEELATIVAEETARLDLEQLHAADMRTQLHQRLADD